MGQLRRHERRHAAARRWPRPDRPGAAAAHGQQNIGFANPLLYTVGKSPTAAATISDVIQGSNDISGSVFGKALGCCTAAAGYDQASGLGSLNIAALSAVAATTVPKQLTVGVTVPAQRDPVAAEHFRATVSCSGECLMGAYAKIQIGQSTSQITQYSQLYELTRKRSRTINIGLDSRHADQAAHAALESHQRITATLYGAIVDPSGSVETHSAGKTLTVRG